QDLRLRGMLHARMVHPPTQSARLAAVDVAPIRRMAGVQHVLQDGSVLGVIATREDQAIAAASALAALARWIDVSTQALPDDADLPRHMRTLQVRRSQVASRGEPGSGRRPHRATYFR